MEMRRFHIVRRKERLIADNFPVLVDVEERVNRHHVNIVIPFAQILAELPATFIHQEHHKNQRRRVIVFVSAQVEIVNFGDIRNQSGNFQTFGGDEEKI